MPKLWRIAVVSRDEQLRELHPSESAVSAERLVPDDDDLVVAVKETRLPGARDFVVLPIIHTNLMKDEAVFRYVLRFFQQAHFMSEARRQPIPDNE